MIFVTFVFAIIDQSYDIIMIQNLFSNYIILTFLEKKTESAWHLTHQLRFILQCVLFRSKGKNISTCLPNGYHSSTFTTSLQEPTTDFCHICFRHDWPILWHHNDWLLIFKFFQMAIVLPPSLPQNQQHHKFKCQHNKSEFPHRVHWNKN